MHYHTQSPYKQIFKTLPEIYFTPPQINWWYLCLLKSCTTAIQGQWTKCMNYVQQDFSCASMMPTPANLTSFCLASTDDTLQSPTNLIRWRITTEAMWTICSKYVFSTSHILGVWKVTLQQGCCTFRHDTVLRNVIEALKTFILNIKEAVVIPVN